MPKSFSSSIEVFIFVLHKSIFLEPLDNSQQVSGPVRVRDRLENIIYTSFAPFGSFFFTLLFAHSAFAALNHLSIFRFT
jgi:hypothetical protein